MFLFVGLIDVIFSDAHTGLPHYLVPMTVADYFCEMSGRYFLQLILPLKGIILHYNGIYLVPSNCMLITDLPMLLM